MLARVAAASAAVSSSTSSCSPFGIRSLLSSAPILGTRPCSSSSSAGAWSPVRTNSSASPSPYVLPNSLLSFGALVNKAFGVGMIEGVPTCRRSGRGAGRLLMPPVCGRAQGCGGDFAVVLCRLSLSLSLSAAVSPTRAVVVTDLQSSI